MTVDAIKTVAIIGAGTMGQGIAHVFAAAGFKVLVYDANQSVSARFIENISKNLAPLIEKGKLTVEARGFILGQITVIDDFPLLKADLVVEAVIENLEVKQKIFAELESVNGPDCILTSNTSSIPVTQIARFLKQPHRFAGLHFFNPAQVMKLVEVIQGKATSQATVKLLFDLCLKIGKHPVCAQDSPGFIVNRIARQFYLEALRLLEDGVADVETIDKLLRSSGFKMGPFELMDLIGVDTNLSVTTAMYEAFNRHPRFKPSAIQQKKVNDGYYGRKNGKGFYEYSNDQK